MREGWHGENHLILYDESETSAASESYNIAGSLPGFAILGLCGWDDFIVRDLSGAVFTVPTVPLDREHLKPFDLPLAGVTFEPENETRNRKPLERPTSLGATWELRFGPDNRFRVLYTFDLDERQVNVLAIGVKKGNRLMIGGEELEL